jgi:hypothetical protein
MNEGPCRDITSAAPISYARAAGLDSPLAQGVPLMSGVGLSRAARPPVWRLAPIVAVPNSHHGLYPSGQAFEDESDCRCVRRRARFASATL